MADLNDFMRAIKKAAVQAVENEKPVEVLFGKVLSDSPLVIEVEQMKLKLVRNSLFSPEMSLILKRRLRSNRHGIG